MFFEASRYRMYLGTQTSYETWCNNGCKGYSKYIHHKTKRLHIRQVQSCKGQALGKVGDGDRESSASRQPGTLGPRGCYVGVGQL